MESFQTLRAHALEKLKVADHLVSTTYSLVKEPKLLISVLENIFNALDLTITALIEYEKDLKSIPKNSSYNEKNFDEKMELFRRKIVTKYGINNNIIDFIFNIKKTLDEHKKSSVEFTKKETFVISDHNYNLIKIEIDDVKKTLTKAKRHVEELFKIIKYEG
jgi:hypothetical protein